MKHWSFVLACVSLAGACALTVEAQSTTPYGVPHFAGGAVAGSPTAVAATLLEKGDTTAAIEHLTQAVKASFHDAPAWHLLGLLQWSRVQHVRSKSYISDVRLIRRLDMADSALRIATQLAPDSARYWLSLARFATRAPYSTVLFSAQADSRKGYNAAKRNNEYDLLALAADMRGMAMWRRYEAVAHRGFTMDGQAFDDQSIRNVRRDEVSSIMANTIIKPKTFVGIADYTSAIDRFTEASEYEPTSQRYARHLFMALAERGQWAELLSVANRRAQMFPLDHSSRMARGLALQRLRRSDEARAAFDTAFITMDDGERERLTSLTRILKWRATQDPKQSGLDSAAYSQMSPAQQQAFAQMFWFINDDVSLSGSSVHHTEFLARVSYADIRFTDEDRGTRGSETDRGDVYIRYGPPDRQNSSTSPTYVIVSWTYKDPKAFFSFLLSQGFASVRFSPASHTDFEYLSQRMPVSWANVRERAALDTIPVRITRFRRNADSSDVVVAAHVPMDSLIGTLDADRLPVMVRVKTMDQTARMRLVDSSWRDVSRETTKRFVEHHWRLRVDSGVNLLRVEALQSDVDRAARALSWVSKLPTSGFDMSDLLLGSPPGSFAGTAADIPRRWHDARMTPSTGIVDSGSALGLLWEVYDATVHDGAMQYGVNITLRPIAGPSAKFPVPFPPLAAGVQLVQGIGRAVKRAISPGGITMSYDRSQPIASTTTPIAVEYLSIALGSLPRGRYSLTIEVEDSATKRKTSRVTALQIR
ncbi:MAG: GWxTD domain-containing protein [Gemmatimonadaceae bacterium]|nr:GWxTD domain-containing protein [Gemmatimonadaceae bacterium]